MTHLSFLARSPSTPIFKLTTLPSHRLQGSQHIVLVEELHSKTVDTDEYGIPSRFTSGLGLGGVMSCVNEAVIHRATRSSSIHNIDVRLRKSTILVSYLRVVWLTCSSGSGVLLIDLKITELLLNFKDLRGVIGPTITPQDD